MKVSQSFSDVRHDLLRVLNKNKGLLGGAEESVWLSAGGSPCSHTMSQGAMALNWVQVVANVVAILFLIFWFSLRFLHIMAVIYG